MKLKRDLLDALFSRYIRQRDSWTCQRCGKPYPPVIDQKHRQGLDAAHVFSRGKQSVRFDPMNCWSMCRGCHSYMDEGQMRDPTPEQDRVSRWCSWFVARFGEQEYELLRLRARTPKKPDRAGILLWLRKELR